MVEPAAGESQHLVAEIDAETALDLGTEQFENATRPGAEIKQGTERAGKQQGADFRLDRVIGGVKLPNAVPLGCVAAEIVLRRLDSSRPHAGEPLAVARNDRVGGVERADQTLHHGGRRTMFSAAEKRPRTLTEGVHQLRLRQKLEMARYPGLRLAQDFRELRHGQLRFSQQTEDAQARLLPGGLEGGIQIIEGDPHNHGGTIPNCVGQDSGRVGRKIDIKISLCNQYDAVALWDRARYHHRSPEWRTTWRTNSASGRARSPSLCPKNSTPECISSAGYARPGPVERNARRTHANRTRSAPLTSIRATRRNSPGLRAALICWCSTGWTNRGAISCCKCRITMANRAAHLRCGRRRVRTRSRPASRRCCRFPVTGCRWWASTVSTAHRSSTSSRILHRPIPSQMRSWAGTRRKVADVGCGSGCPRGQFGQPSLGRSHLAR